MKPLHKSSSGPAPVQAAYVSLRPTIIPSWRLVPDDSHAKTPGGPLPRPSSTAEFQHSPSAAATREQTNWLYFGAPSDRTFYRRVAKERARMIRD